MLKLNTNKDKDKVEDKEKYEDKDKYEDIYKQGKG
jgi:hypothetical protein